MNYFQIVRRRKIEKHTELPYEIYRRVAIALFLGLTFELIILFEKLFMDRILLSYFFPILVVTVYFNLKLIKKGTQI